MGLQVEDIQEWLIAIDYQVPVAKNAREARVVTDDDSCHLALLVKKLNVPHIINHR